MKTKLKTTKQRVDGLLAVYPVCTADQKERFCQAMVEEYELGFAEGHKAGQDEGYKQGHSEDFEKGRSYGLEEGHNEAQQEAYSKGKADGRRSGFSEGRLKGLKEGLKEGRKSGSDKARAERLGVSLLEALMQGSGKPACNEVAAKIRNDLPPFATPSLPDSQTDQTGQSSQLEQANQTGLPVQTDQTDQPDQADQTGQLDLAGQADKMDLPSLVAKRFAQGAAWDCGPARAEGPYGPRCEGAMAGKAPVAGNGSQTGGALLEAPQHSVDDADMDAPKAPLSARIADTASAIRKACASHARRCCTNAHLLWPLALALAFGAGATSTQWMDAWLQKTMLADRAQVEAAADPAPNARVLRNAETAGKVQAPASGTGLVSGLKDNMAERLADILAAPLTGSPTQDSQDARPLPDGWRDRQGMPGQHGQQGQQGQQLQPAQNAQSAQSANKAQSAQHTKGDKACGTRNGNQAGPGSQASQASGQFIQVSQSSGQTSDSSVSTLSTSDSRDSRASHGIRESGDNGDATRANRSASSGQAEAGGRKALDQRQGLGKALVQAPLQSGDIPKPAGPKGSLGETARLLGEAEAIKLKTRLAKEEAACLKAQIETARLRRELVATDQHSAAGAHATLQARTPRDAATGDAPSDAAGNAPDVQSSGASGASQATAAPARPAGSATGATAAGTAHPAPQASPALALHSLGRIVSIQDIGGTLTAAVRTPSGALAMLKPGSRWAGGRVTAVTPRGLRLKLGARTIAVPF